MHPLKTASPTPSGRTFPEAKVWLVIAVFAVFALQAHGHGFVHEQIAELTRRLEEQPGDPALLHRRAELQRDHGNPDAARIDLETALLKSPRSLDLLLALTRIERETGHLPAAHRAIDTALADHPRNPVALREKALLHSTQKHLPRAARAWEAVLRHDPSPGPDSFLACAAALQSETATPAADHRALDVLNRGLRVHPNIIPLRQRAAALCVRLGKIPQAESHFAALRDNHPSTLHPRLRATEGTIWLEEGRRAEALLAYREARTAFNSLPASRRSQPGFQSLEKAITQALVSLAEA